MQNETSSVRISLSGRDVLPLRSPQNIYLLPREPSGCPASEGEKEPIVCPARKEGLLLSACLAKMLCLNRPLINASVSIVTGIFEPCLPQHTRSKRNHFSDAHPSRMYATLHWKLLLVCKSRHLAWRRIYHVRREVGGVLLWSQADLGAKTLPAADLLGDLGQGTTF